jgi:antitoxin (DNA-binding transcriptional repressor) of toxin-antitoxin stability system
MTYVVLKALPKGQQPGETVELTDAEATVFLLVGAVRRDEPEPTRPGRGRYRRADLQAEPRSLDAE